MTGDSAESGKPPSETGSDAGNAAQPSHGAQPAGTDTSSSTSSNDAQKPSEAVLDDDHQQLVPFGHAKEEVDDETDDRAPANTPFVNKVWRIVNDPANQKYIKWVSGGKSILIVDREGFEKHLLPLYFKHKRFTSFVRQLNMYGWHKVPDLSAGTMQSSDEHWQFSNPNFIRDQPELLQKITRNRHKSGSAQQHNGAVPGQPPVQSIPNPNGAGRIPLQIEAPNSRNGELPRVIPGIPGAVPGTIPLNASPTDIKAVLNELRQIRERQLTIGDDMGRIRKDNDLLWSEYAQMRERYDKQSQTLNKIFRFLATMYGNQNKMLDFNDNNKLIDAISDIDPARYGLISHANGVPNLQHGQHPNYNIHELQEIEELQHQIEEASNNSSNQSTPQSTSGPSPAPSPANGAPAPGGDGRRTSNSLIPARPSSASLERQANNFTYNPYVNSNNQIVRSSPRHSQQYRNVNLNSIPQPNLGQQQPRSQNQPQNQGMPRGSYPVNQNTPQDNPQKGPMNDYSQGGPPPNGSQYGMNELDSSYFPDFGDLDKLPNVPLGVEDRDQLERDVQAADDGISSIEDWAKGIPGEDLYNLEDYLAPDGGEEKGQNGEPTKKRKKTDG